MIRFCNKYLLILFLFFVLLPPFSNTAYSAYRTDSAEVQTKVGNPTDPSPTSDNPVIKSARDVKAGYDKCSGGYSYISQVSCVANYLITLGYNSSQVEAYRARATNSDGGLGCTECMGYVAAVFSLLSGVNGMYYGSANAFYYDNSFNIGGYTYTATQDLPPKPGDVGAIADEYNGHVFIVTESYGDLIKVIESNIVGCKITDGREIYWYRFKFFRRNK